MEEKDIKTNDKISKFLLNQLNPNIFPVLELFYKDRYWITVEDKYNNLIVHNSIRPLNYIRDNYFDICITIHYPEITITNKNEQSHTIKDLYIKIVFHRLKYSQSSDGRYFDTSNCTVYMLGIRKTITPVEYINIYGHSHLSGYNYTDDDIKCFHKLGEFCLGSGPLAEEIHYLKNGDPITIQKVFYLIDSYLEWESIEGSPYRYMKNLLNTTVPTPMTLSPGYMIDFIRTKPKGIKLSMNGASISITLSDQFELDLANWLSNGDDYMQSNLVVKLPNGEYKGYKHNTVMTSSEYEDAESYEEDYLFYFKGKSIKLKIYEDEQQIPTFYPHPNVTNLFKEVFTKHALKTYCTKYCN